MKDEKNSADFELSPDFLKDVSVRRMVHNNQTTAFLTGYLLHAFLWDMDYAYHYIFIKLPFDVDRILHYRYFQKMLQYCKHDDLRKKMMEREGQLESILKRVRLKDGNAILFATERENENCLIWRAYLETFRQSSYVDGHEAFPRPDEFINMSGVDETYCPQALPKDRFFDSFFEGLAEYGSDLSSLFKLGWDLDDFFRPFNTELFERVSVTSELAFDYPAGWGKKFNQKRLKRLVGAPRDLSDMDRELSPAEWLRKYNKQWESEYSDFLFIEGEKTSIPRELGIDDEAVDLEKLFGYTIEHVFNKLGAENKEATESQENISVQAIESQADLPAAEENVNAEEITHDETGAPNRKKITENDYLGISIFEIPVREKKSEYEIERSGIGKETPTKLNWTKASIIMCLMQAKETGVTPDELRKKLKDLDIELSPQSRDSRISETRKLLKPLELEITSAKEKEAYTEEEAGKYVLVNRRKK